MRNIKTYTIFKDSNNEFFIQNDCTQMSSSVTRTKKKVRFSSQDAAVTVAATAQPSTAHKLTINKVWILI
jgi:hypothetical protein